RPWRQGHERPGRVRGQARRLAAGTAGYRRDVLLLLLLIVPIVELYVLIQVGQEIGALETIGLLILVSIVGAWLAKREGIGVWLRMQQQIAEPRVPTAELADAFLILLAAALLLTPGFVTDV